MAASVSLPVQDRAVAADRGAASGSAAMDGSPVHELQAAIAAGIACPVDGTADMKTISVSRLAGLAIMGVAAWVPIAAATARLIV